ncbi:MAG: hypothetical protein U0176_00435 [Bacteroidia bacterium]
MKKQLFLTGCFLAAFCCTSVYAQVTWSTGGPIGPNTPNTNTNVGINQPNPQADLDVRDEIRVTNLASNNNYLSIATPGAYHTITSTNNMGLVANNNAQINFTLGGLVRTTMLSNGNVGIGTASPADKFEVTTTSAANGRVATLRNNNYTTFFMVDAPFAGAYNYLPLLHDNAIFWDNNTAGNAPANGLVIAPWAHSNNGIRIDGATGNVGISTNNATAKLTVNGNALIGDPATVTLPGTYKLYVQGGILTEKCKIALVGTANWADYVFSDDYKLMPLEEVESFIQANDHLPNVPSAQSLVDNGGIEVEKMLAKQMEKIEELTLYIIEQNKRIAELESHINDSSK